MVAGPRLDSPSAIGDEGRPRAASLWLATLAVVAVVSAVGVTIGEPTLVLMLGILAGPAVAGAALLERPSFVQQVVAHLLLVTFGSALALLVLVGSVLDRTLFVAAACALSVTGVVAAWADVDGEALRRAVTATAMTYLSMVISAIAVAVLLVTAAFGWTTLLELVETDAPLPSLVGFLAVAAATAGGLLLGLRWLPLRELTPRSRRDRLETYLSHLRRRLLTVVAGSVVLIGALVALWDLTGLGGLVVRFSLLEALLVGLTAPVVVWPLVAVGLGAVCLGVLAGILERLASQGSDAARGNVATTVGVGLTALGLLWIALFGLGLGLGRPALVWSLSTTGISIVPLLLIGPVAVVLVGGAAILAGGLGLLPRRATGPAVAATGLLAAAIGVGQGSPLLAFACIAAALLVWDCATFGLEVTAELGHRPETRRLELVHGTVAVGVALGAVLLAVGLESLRTGLFAGIGGTGGAVVIALGAVLLLVLIRG